MKDKTGPNAFVDFLSVSSATSVVNMAVSDFTTEDTENTEEVAERPRSIEAPKMHPFISRCITENEAFFLLEYFFFSSKGRVPSLSLIYSPRSLQTSKQAFPAGCL